MIALPGEQNTKSPGFQGHANSAREIQHDITFQNARRAASAGIGAVLYFLLCGRPPFEADNAAALFFAHVNQPVVPPSELLGHRLPADVDAIVLRALEKDPGARYPTAADLALALASCTVAGRWTFGHATDVARKSSRPPPPGVLDALPSLKAPRVPKLATGKTGH